MLNTANKMLCHMWALDSNSPHTAGVLTDFANLENPTPELARQWATELRQGAPAFSKRLASATVLDKLADKLLKI